MITYGFCSKEGGRSLKVIMISEQRMSWLGVTGISRV
jgi:hypothetical protein